MSLWTPDGEHQVPPKPAPEPELTPEQTEQAETMARELAEARTRLLETEVATVLVNHALGIYELAAIHIAVDEPDLDEAKLAIDALACLIEGLEGRLGDGEPTLLAGRVVQGGAPRGTATPRVHVGGSDRTACAFGS